MKVVLSKLSPTVVPNCPEIVPEIPKFVPEIPVPEIPTEPYDAPGLVESALTVSEASGLDFAYMIRPDPEDENAVYVFALNADMARRPATISFQSTGGIASVTVVDEDRDIAPENNAWSDLFAPLELHVYRAFMTK